MFGYGFCVLVLCVWVGGWVCGLGWVWVGFVGFVGFWFLDCELRLFVLQCCVLRFGFGFLFGGGLFIGLRLIGGCVGLIRF